MKERKRESSHESYHLRDSMHPSGNKHRQSNGQHLRRATICHSATADDGQENSAVANAIYSPSDDLTEAYPLRASEATAGKTEHTSARTFLDAIKRPSATDPTR